MAEAHFSFAPLGSAGDSNTQHMHDRFSTANVNCILIVLTDAHGVIVCTTMLSDGDADASFNIPAQTPCFNREHYTRAMQVYHYKDDYPFSFDPATGIYQIIAPLIPPVVPEAAGGD